MKYITYTLKNFREIPFIERINNELKFNIEVVGNILPFKVNNYLINKLINWNNIETDPVFLMTFPQKEMLSPEHFQMMSTLLKRNSELADIRREANKIRMQLNPHPASQIQKNVPELNGKKLWGLQHKYRETVLFFPSRGQTCHAYCSFCFRWPQFVGIRKLRLVMREVKQLIEYLKTKPDVTDILITGGDPLIMRTVFLKHIIDELLKAKLPNLINIRIGTKALSWWPYRFIDSHDAGDLLRLFRKVNRSGKRLALMTHFNHPNELSTQEVKIAIDRILDTGTVIRSQAPILKNINDSPEIWQKLWTKQVEMGIVPYYMFIARNTGAQRYFALPLIKAWDVYKKAYKNVSGLSRTVRGPIMSTDPGKIQILGPVNIGKEKVLCLQFIQARNPDWVDKLFFAEYNETAIWRNELIPAFGEKNFFYERDSR